MTMPVLKIRLTKGRDARDLITCIREDGSRTWARGAPGIPVHDLAHHVIESTLGTRDGFYGMVLDGWDIPDFEVPGATERIQARAVWVEHAVNLLMIDALNAPFASADEFREMLATVAGDKTPLEITDAQFRGMRETLAMRIREWRGLRGGESMEMNFECP